METTSDIFNEMRNWDYHSDLDLNAHEVLSQYADRFMDAHRREVEQYLKSLVECDKQIALLKKGHSNLEEIITKLKSELGEAAKWTRAELSRELAMNVEINNNLRLENSRLKNELKECLCDIIGDYCHGCVNKRDGKCTNGDGECFAKRYREVLEKVGGTE